MTYNALPIVDMQSFHEGTESERLTAARAFGRAFEESGFVALTGHGISEAMIQSLYETVKTFFAMPLADKMKYALPQRALNRGYLPIGMETVAATLDRETPPDLCEALVFKSLFQEAEQKRGAGAGSERWENIWPAEPSGLAELVTGYFWSIDRLTGTVYRMAALALDLPENHFEPYFREHWNTLRFVNYPDQPVEPLPGQLRYGAHHDYGALAFVRQDAAPGGLQVCDCDGGWHDIPAVPGSFIVNVGDLLSHWTNGRWRSTLHRVMNPPRALTGSTQRLSMVLFSRPDDGAEISCLPTCHDALLPPKYLPVKAGAFTRAKMEQSAAQKAPVESAAV